MAYAKTETVPTLDFEIRTACEDDRSEFSRLFIECKSRYGIFFDKTLVYVEWQDGKSVIRGYLSHNCTSALVIHNKITGKNDVIREIESIVVDPKHQRRGIATRLINALIAQTEEQFYRIYAKKESAIDNLCKKLGFIAMPMDFTCHNNYVYAKGCHP